MLQIAENNGDESWSTLKNYTKDTTPLHWKTVGIRQIAAGAIDSLTKTIVWQFSASDLPVTTPCPIHTCLYDTDVGPHFVVYEFKRKLWSVLFTLATVVSCTVRVEHLYIYLFIFPLFFFSFFFFLLLLLLSRKRAKVVSKQTGMSVTWGTVLLDWCLL